MDDTPREDSRPARQVAPSVDPASETETSNPLLLTPSGQPKKQEHSGITSHDEATGDVHEATTYDIERKVTDKITEQIQTMMENLSSRINKMVKDEIKNAASQSKNNYQHPWKMKQNTTTQPEENTAGHKSNETNNTGDVEGYTLVQNRRRRVNQIIGTGTTVDTEMTAGERNIWIYAGCLSQETTEDKVKTFLNKKGIPRESITCEELRTRGSNKAFKIGIPFQHRADTENPDFWPRGVVIRPFRFPHGGRAAGVELPTL
mgnify:CR=1 FL=1